MSAVPKFTMKQLLDAGVHFGHKSMRWNPAMAPYIYGTRSDLHIINLQKTVPLLYKALEAARDVAANNGRILFVGTKTQASEIVAEQAKRCGQYFVNHRWLGGTLTNWPTVSQSIKTMRDIETQLNDPEILLNKKERLQLTRKMDKLEKTLGGIKDMGGKPNLLFIIDTNKEDIAVLEARKLGIPVIAVVDTNCNPEGIEHIIPGNDDAIRSIKLYCTLIADAILAGLEASLGRAAANDKNAEESRKQRTPKDLKGAFRKKDEGASEGAAAASPEAAAPEAQDAAARKKPVGEKNGKKPAAKKSEDKAEDKVASLSEAKAESPKAKKEAAGDKKAAV